MMAIYFYSGNTPSVMGRSQQFCGIYHTEDESHPETVFDNIITDRKQEHGIEVVLTAFNKVD